MKLFCKVLPLMYRLWITLLLKHADAAMFICDQTVIRIFTIKNVLYSVSIPAR